LNWLELNVDKAAIVWCIAVVAVAIGLTLSGSVTGSEISKSITVVQENKETSSDEIKEITEKAFIYAYPMIENYKTMYNAAVDETSELYIAPFNQLHHNENLSTPKDTWVTTPNSDTLYSRAWLDLRTEPVIITIPEIEQDRYFTFQLIDFYSHNFGYIGTRTTGNDGGTFLIVGPSWDGKIPNDVDGVYPAETEYVTILARTQVKNQDDVSNALEIMKNYELKTISEYLGKPKPQSIDKVSFIPWNEEKAYGSEFVNYLNLILTWSEIHPSEKQMFEDFSKIGINVGRQIEFDNSKGRIIDEATLSAMQKIQDGIFVLGTFENGWLVLDGFGDREFHGTDYLRRSVAAMYGLYGNTLEEALYPAGLVDSEKILLDGSKSNYQIKFLEEPPVGAFWSVTMYHQESRLLVENPIDRWLINSVSSISKNEDGSFVIFVQHESPPEDKRNNWLPAPDGPIYMILRLYVPSEKIIYGDWEMPLIEKVK
jgi:hypothetical protein